MSSPSVFNRAPILRDEKHHQLNVGESYHQRNNHSRKRRPVDPPEEGNNLFDGVNEYDTVNNNNIKRLRASSPDDLLDALSLKPPDPPAHSFCKKRKKEHDDDDNDSIGTSSHGGDIRYTKSPKFQYDERGGETSALTSIATNENETEQPLSSSSTKPDPPSEHDIQVTSTTTQQQETSEMENDMSIDDNSSSNSNSDISISEGSLQRAMYQAVFGRRRNSAQHQFHSIPSTISSGNSGNGIGCPYDAVDSKIEDLIRRSRLEAEIQGRKEVKQTVKGDGRVDQNGDVEDGMDTDGD